MGFPQNDEQKVLTNSQIQVPLPETNSKFAPENGWLEDEFPFGARPIFRGELLVLGRVDSSPNRKYVIILLPLKFVAIAESEEQYAWRIIPWLGYVVNNHC